MFLEILGFILFLVLFLGIILFLVEHLNFPLTVAPLTIILSQIIILYFFAIINILRFGFFIIFAISSVLFLYAIIKHKNWSKLFHQLTKPLTLLFLIFLIGTFFYTRGTFFHLWDEFSHWGLAYKNLIITNRLPGENSAVFIFNYPPGTTLFQYYVENIIGLWQKISHFESNGYFAQMIFLFSCLLAVFPHSSWKKALFQLISFAVVVLSVFAFGYKFQDLYVDLCLGLLFAAGLARFIFYKKIYKGVNYYILLLIAATLPLIKPLGIYFSMLIVLGAVILECANQQRQTHSNSFRTILGSSKKSLKKELVILLLIPILINISWGFYLKQFNAPQNTFSLFENKPVDSTEILVPNRTEYIYNLYRVESNERLFEVLYKQPIKKNISVEGLIKTFSANAPFRTRLIIEAFINSIEKKPYSNSNLTIKLFLFLILALTIIELKWIIKNDQPKRDRVVIVNILLMIGFIGYLLILLLAYIFIFSAYEGIMAPSLTRYAGSYLIAWFILKVGFLQNNIEVSSENINFQSNVSKWLMAGLFVAAFIKIPLSSYLLLPNTASEKRIHVNNIYKREELDALPPESNVYQIWQDGAMSNGYELHLMRFQLCPLQSNFYGWRLGSPYSKNDRDTINFSPKDWISFLNSYHYSHVLLAETDDHFLETYSSLLDKPPRDGYRLYKVLPDSLERMSK